VDGQLLGPSVGEDGKGELVEAWWVGDDIDLGELAQPEAIEVGRERLRS
jgi:hypothetical protein